METIRLIFNKSKDLKIIAQKTILKNRQSQEEESGFAYTLEEVALIMDYDMKVGPLGKYILIFWQRKWGQI